MESKPAAQRTEAKDATAEQGERHAAIRDAIVVSSDRAHVHRASDDSEIPTGCGNLIIYFPIRLNVGFDGEIPKSKC